MTNSNYSDNATLIESLKIGDQKAYTYIIDLYFDKLCTYAYGLSKNTAIAEDIVQNILLKTWEKRSKLDTSLSLKSFLYKMVYHEFIDIYRRNKSVTVLEEKYQKSVESFMVDQEDESFENAVNAVRQEIEKLPEKCKIIFILSKKEGLTNAEIAEHLDISVKTVEAQITKAFSILREIFKDKLSYILFTLFG